MILQFIADGRHGWLKVRRTDAELFGILPSKYSYQDEDYLYLEEDIDAYAFMRAAKSAGIEIAEPTTIYLDDDSDRNAIRRLEHCP